MIYDCHVRMAAHEWSSTTSMDGIAIDWFVTLSQEDRPSSSCTVNEHAGWWLMYGWINGEVRVVGSANDGACFSPEVGEWWSVRNRAEKEGAKVQRVGIDRPAKIEPPVATA